MQFRQCAIGGIRYVDFNGFLCVKPPTPDVKPFSLKTFDVSGLHQVKEFVLLVQKRFRLQKDITEFLTVLALCHTCRVEKKGASKSGTGSGVLANPFRGTTGAAKKTAPLGTDLDYQASSPDEKGLHTYLILAILAISRSFSFMINKQTTSIQLTVLYRQMYSTHYYWVQVV